VAATHRMSSRCRFWLPVMSTVGLVLAGVGGATWSGLSGVVLTSVRSEARLETRPRTQPGPQEVEKPVAASYRIEDLPLRAPRLGRKLNSDQLTPTLVRKADEVLWTQYPPIGAKVPIEVDGKIYVGRVEKHFHEVGGPKRPWGYHRGMTLYSVE
jgi:hypothetical protein